MLHTIPSGSLRTKKGYEIIELQKGKSMNITEVQEQMRFRTIDKIPLRVTYYARVSSDRSEQLNSLENQVNYYEDLIRRNKAWTFVPGYIDEGISAISVKNRKQFLHMIEDAKAGMFDLIITKEISRFARNTVDSLQYTRLLLRSGVCVYFQNDNINTADFDSELRLTIMSSIAQDELRKLSSRVKFGHQQAIRSGVVLGNSRIFGYRKQDKKLVLDEGQAPMVKQLFEMYATDEYSLKQLEEYFYGLGYRNNHGNMISHNTLSNIISNPKYKGYYVGNKYRVIDMFTKQQEALSPDKWVMYRDESGETVPAIVDEDTWERANAVLKRRSDDVKGRQGICNHQNLLTGKLYCAHCGSPFYRRESKDRQGNCNSTWVCSGKIKKGAASCPSISIYESEIKPILSDIFGGIDAETDKIKEQYLKMFGTLNDQTKNQSVIDAQKQIIATAEKKKNTLLTLLATDKITTEYFSEFTKKCEEEIAEAEGIIKEQLLLSPDSHCLERRMEELSAILHSLKMAVLQEHAIDAKFVQNFIERIDVWNDHQNHVRLIVTLKTGKRLENLALQEKTKHVLRTGQMSKKMIENAEHSMK